MANQVPLTVIAGFLGAGKTTLINHLLKDNDGVRYTVLVNDFGDLAIDEDLIESHEGDTIALANGCVCCSIGDDLIETLMEILAQEKRPDHIIIEASGVADPRPIAEIGSLDPNLRRDLTIVVIDVDQIRKQQQDPLLQDTVERQLTAADLIALNHARDMDRAEQQDLEVWLEDKTNEPSFFVTEDGSLPTSLLSARAPFETTQGHSHKHAHHGEVFRSETLRMRDGVCVDEVRQALGGLPPSVVRVKGYLVDGARSFEVQKAGRRISIKSVAEKDERESLLVFIGTREMPEIAELEGLGKIFP